MPRETKTHKMTPEEEQVWEDAFRYGIEEFDMDDEAADKYAFDELCKVFPRLRRFDHLE